MSVRTDHTSGENFACPSVTSALFEQSPLGIFIVAPEGSFLDINPGMCRMLGYARDELIGAHVSTIQVHHLNQHTESSQENAICEAGQERQLRCKDGSVISAEVTETVLSDGKSLGIIQDISSRKQHELISTRLSAIVESSEDAIVSKDLNGVVMTWNAGAERIFGYTADEMIGTSIMRLIPPDRQDEEHKILGKIRRGIRVDHFETVRQTKDMRLIFVSVTVSPIRDGSGKIVGASKIARDISVLKAREREIDRVTRLYASLSQVNQAIVWTKTREGLFNKVCRVLIEHGGFQMAWIGWNDPETHLLMPVAAWGDESGYLLRIQTYSDDRPEGRGPSGMAYRAAQPYICNSLLDDPATEPWRAELESRGFRSSASFPIWMNDEVRGVLNIYSNEVGFFQEKEIALLEEAATDISFALDNLEREEIRRQAEVMAQNEKRFSDSMIESMPGILYFYDSDGRFLRWNNNFENVSGYSAQEIAKMHPLDFFSDEEQEALKQRIAEVFEKGEASIEARFLAKDGHSIPYFFTGRRVVFNEMTCLVGVGIDISERVKAENEWHKMQARLEAVVENLQEGLVIADPDGDLLRWNPESLRLLGFSDLQEGRRRQRDFVDIFELYTLDGAKIPTDQWPLARVRNGETLADFQALVRRIGSDWNRVISYTGLRVNYEQDKTLAFLTLNDITDRMQAETALRGDRDELELQVAARTADLQSALIRAEAADKIKSSFLATMSHELRTPLNSIIGFTGILLQNLAGPLNAEQIKQLNMVQGSARHLLELINDVLDISKIESGQIEVHAESFDLQDSLNRVVSLVRPMAEKKSLLLKAIVSPELGKMHSDRRRMEQIMLNLLNNAIKFTEEGRVTLVADRVEYLEPAEAGKRCAVKIQVADTGIGIKPEDLDTLFQPFRQLDSSLTRQYEGTGLGLAICRRLAKLLGGEIIASSEWSKGSVFTVTIPMRLEWAKP